MSALLIGIVELIVCTEALDSNVHLLRLLLLLLAPSEVSLLKLNTNVQPSTMLQWGKTKR